MKKGYFGNFGGQFVPELLMPPLLELEDAYKKIVLSEEFDQEFTRLLKTWVGRPSALTRCDNLSRIYGIDLWLKREDLNHTGAHKINNTLGQALLTKMLGKKVLMAETGAGQHGVASATAAALLDLECIVFMGSTDVARQSHNVRRMELMGGRVVPVESGTKTLKDAINEALRYWIKHQEDTHYCLGTAAGPYPFPDMVRHFQSVISKEARAQFMEENDKLPDTVVACVGGGSNAIGMFAEFVPDTDVKLLGVEAEGTGEEGCDNSATLTQGTSGVLHGMKTLLLQTDEGQILPSHSIAPGLDYPGVGPEHVHLQDIGRAQYVGEPNATALHAFKELCSKEGILPALESCHAVGHVLVNADKYKDQSVLVCLSGRGDKDMGIVEEYL